MSELNIEKIQQNLSLENALQGFEKATSEKEKAEEELAEAQSRFNIAKSTLEEMGDEIVTREDLRFENVDGWDMPEIAKDVLKNYGATDEQIEKAQVLTPNDEINQVDGEKFDQVLKECGWEESNIEYKDFIGFGKNEHEIYPNGAEVVFKKI